MWVPGEKVEAGKKLTRYFRFALSPSRRGANDAALLVASRDKFRVIVSGNEIAKGTSWGGFRRVSLPIARGANPILIEATSNGTSGGLAVLLQYRGARMASPSDWEAASAPAAPC